MNRLRKFLQNEDRALTVLLAASVSLLALGFAVAVSAILLMK
jgi:hypothetical protein